jgi:hypothetical protein
VSLGGIDSGRRTGYDGLIMRFQSTNQVQSAGVETGSAVAQQSSCQITDRPLSIHDDSADNIQLKQQKLKSLFNQSNGLHLD